MKTNVGKTDKAVRIVLGIVIIALGFAYGSWFGLIGIIPILTAFMSFCPLYSVFGINTCPVRSPRG